MSDRKRTIFILMAVLVLAAGIVMAGNTFASQVDKQSGNEVAVDTVSPGSDSYNVDIAYYTGNDSAGNPQYQSLKAKGSTFSDGMIWCPDRTEIAYIKITNQELFPVECAPILVAAKPDTQTVDLGDVMNFAVKTGWKTPADMNAANWKQLLDWADGSGGLSAGRHTALKAVNGQQAMYPLAPGESAYFALAMHMNETASDKYQQASLDLQIILDVDANYKPDANPANTQPEDISK